jgi:hypothetical protein
MGSQRGGLPFWAGPVWIGAGSILCCQSERPLFHLRALSYEVTVLARRIPYIFVPSVESCTSCRVQSFSGHCMVK